jgi:nucleoside-diphosphate-sugar epimerase
MNKRILITGAAGFVGRRLVKFMLDKGYYVIGVDNIAELTGGIDPKNGWPLYNPNDYNNFEFYKEDCREWFKKNYNKKFDYVFHLAAMVGGREIIENNPLTVAEDLSIDSQFWEWCTKSKPEKIICFSSSACYPIELQKYGNFRLLKENDISFKNNIGMPDMTYGWAKLTCEYLANIAYEKYNLKSVCYRPFSGYGEDQDLNYPFPSICNRILKNKDKKLIKVWGSGNQMRDFIYIDDCIEGVFQTMDKINDGSALNLSTGIFTSFIEFTKQACNILGYNPDVEGVSNKPEGVFARGGDTTKQKKFGFYSKVKLEDGIKKTFNYLNKINS